LFLRPRLLPLVPSRRGHQAAPLLEGLAIGRRRLHAIGAGVDGGIGPLLELLGLQPERTQAPARPYGLPAVAGRPDDRHDIGRRDIVALAQERRRPLRQGQAIELDDLLPTELVGIAATHAGDLAPDCPFNKGDTPSPRRAIAYDHFSPSSRAKPPERRRSRETCFLLTRQPNRSLRFASLRSAPVGMTGV